MSLGKSDPVGDPSADPGRAPRRLDATALKAYAHPLRLKVLRYLSDHGAATATTLAQHLGESTGQTSYHLRQLAKHGLVEDDPTRGTGRERWWRPTSFQVDATRLREDPETAPAARAMLAAVVTDRARALQRWVEESAAATPEQVETSQLSESTLVLSPAETEQLVTDLNRALDPWVRLSSARQDGTAERPDDAGRVRAYLDVFPLLDDA